MEAYMGLGTEVGNSLRRIVLASFAVFGLVASASTVNLQRGDSVTLGGTTVTCDVAPSPPQCNTFYGNVYCTSRPGEACKAFYGNVYCGFQCEAFYGHVYCADSSYAKCQTFYGNVYCGQRCETFYGEVYCDGQKARPATPAKPARPRG